MDWILLPDSMPVEQQEVLIAIQWVDGSHTVSAGLWQEQAWYGCWFDFHNPIQKILHGKVVAWMPHPSFG